ncbi:hypothetical protein FHR32_002886 [Streptosporangium album]|uniref:Uncharacterized protein n=1 Tax=Streptosporangium album TaxID=47479 RepID=A0A7W7W977_9ACTN|nr:hypothetical protein [Streptosporangium album]
MRDPNPTSADQWSQWDTDPKPPTCWPGLGNEHGDGYEIDRRGVKAVSGNLVKLAVSTRCHDVSPGCCIRSHRRVPPS